MTTREQDLPETKPQRMVALSSVFTTMVASVCGTAVIAVGATLLVMWKDSDKEALRRTNDNAMLALQFAQVNQKQAEILAVMTQISTDQKAQNQQLSQLVADLKDHERRLIRLEPRQ